MKKGVFKMSFKDLVTKSLRTNDQIKQEANDAENQANKYAAEYIVKLIKDDIITKANKAEYDANRISNIIQQLSNIRNKKAGWYCPMTGQLYPHKKKIL